MSNNYLFDEIIGWKIVEHNSVTRYLSCSFKDSLTRKYMECGT